MFFKYYCSGIFTLGFTRVTVADLYCILSFYNAVIQSNSFICVYVVFLLLISQFGGGRQI